MEMDKSYKKITDEQKEIMVRFIEENLKMNKGILNKDFTKEKSLELWTELTNKLNACIGPKKSLLEWKKCWTDMKRNTKDKILKIKNQTDNNTFLKEKLSSLQEKIFSLIRNDVSSKKSYSFESEMEDQTAQASSVSSTNTATEIISVEPSDSLLPNTTNDSNLNELEMALSCPSNTHITSIIEENLSLVGKDNTSASPNPIIPIKEQITCSIQHSNYRGKRRKNQLAQTFKAIDRFFDLQEKKIELKRKALEIKEKELEFNKNMKKRELQIKENSLNIRQEELEVRKTTSASLELIATTLTSIESHFKTNL